MNILFCMINEQNILTGETWWIGPRSGRPRRSRPQISFVLIPLECCSNVALLPLSVIFRQQFTNQPANPTAEYAQLFAAPIAKTAKDIGAQIDS